MAEVKKFKTIVADPPWDQRRGPPWSSNLASLPLPYQTMSVEQIAALPVQEITDDSAHLYLWTTNKYVESAYGVCRSWGFKPSCLLTWCKKPHGMGIGGTFIQTTEFILFCRNGTLPAMRRIDTTWWQWTRRKHSEKPHEFMSIVESVSPPPRVELFARNRRDGWAAWGNEVESDAIWQT